MGYKNVRFVNWDGWIGSLYLAPGRSPRYFWDEGPQWKGRDPVEICWLNAAPLNLRLRRNVTADEEEAFLEAVISEYGNHSYMGAGWGDELDEIPPSAVPLAFTAPDLELHRRRLEEDQEQVAESLRLSELTRRLVEEAEKAAPARLGLEPETRAGDGNGLKER
jgi:hypothetical protein